MSNSTTRRPTFCADCGRNLMLSHRQTCPTVATDEPDPIVDAIEEIEAARSELAHGDITAAHGHLCHAFGLATRARGVDVAEPIGKAIDAADDNELYEAERLAEIAAESLAKLQRTEAEELLERDPMTACQVSPRLLCRALGLGIYGRSHPFTKDELRALRRLVTAMKKAT